MEAYPTLSVDPSFPIEEEKEDTTLRSPTESGYVFSRPRYTKCRMSYKLVYKNMSDSDKTTLESFVTTVREGSDIFTWTHPISSTIYNVRFAKDGIPKFQYVGPALWDCNFVITEV